jgi:hypothetical protein
VKYEAGQIDLLSAPQLQEPQSNSQATPLTALPHQLVEVTPDAKRGM